MILRTSHPNIRERNKLNESGGMYYYSSLYSLYSLATWDVSSQKSENTEYVLYITVYSSIRASYYAVRHVLFKQSR